MNLTIVKGLWERRNKVINDIQTLSTLTEGRDASEAEQAEEARMVAELDDIDGKIKKGLDELEKARLVDESMKRYKDLSQSPVPGVAEARNEEIDSSLRAFLKGERRSWEYEVDSRVSQYYNLRSHEWEGRALLDSTSNMPLPHSFSGQLYEALVAYTAVLRAKTSNDSLYITTSGEAMDVPRATAHGAAAWQTEGQTITGTDQTLSAVTLNAYKAGQLVQVSRELVDDEGFDIVGYVARSAGRNCGILADAGYVVGSGTGQPTGFQPNVSVGKQGPVGTATSLGAQNTAGQGGDLLIDLKYSILEPYRANAYWMMADGTLAAVCKLKTSNGDMVWQSSLVPGQPDTILGRPVLSDANMPAMAANAKSIAFGDFNGYAVRIVRGVRFERSDDFAFGSDLITFKAILRTDGKLVDTGAIKVFQNSAT